jgi:malate dehydrogenase
VPVRLGSDGIEEVLELELTDDEKRAFEESAAAVREVVGVLGSAE